MKPVLTPQLHAIFSTLVEDACGVHYSLQDRSLFEAKLVTQAAEAGYDSLLDYYYRLRYDDPDGVELRALVQSLVVHETYFFRELPPLLPLVEHLDQIVKQQGRARVWSAACSTGEEPVTMAMLLAERGILDRVEIIATDISDAALHRARSGAHSRRSVREGAPDELVRKYLDLGPSGITTPAWLRTHVKFQRLNLLDAAAIRALGTFDVILCRNVLIYFRDSSITRIIELLGGALSPGGLLTVGVSESLLRFGTALVCEERAGAFFYRGAK